VTGLPLVRTEFPGVYRRGKRYVVVYRAGSRQCKQAAATFSEACAIKLARDAETRADRRGPTLHAFALGWLDRYAGSGHDSVRENTRREYRRLLVAFALSYFDREVRVGDLDRVRVQQFVDWLTTQPGRDGRLRDRSIANAVTPLRLALDAAVAQDLLDVNPFEAVVLPRRRAGRAWEMKERRFLTREELGRLLAEAPPKWRPLFDLLAATGLRISEAIALRWSDLVLDGPAPHLQVTRAIVKGVVGAPKSRHGKRLVPLPNDLAGTLRALRPAGAPDDALIFLGRDGGPSDPGALRRRVLVPAAGRAELSGVGFHTLRHTCASLLIESGLNVLRLQRWMGHHSPAFTLEVYGHLLDASDLAPPLDLSAEVRASIRSRPTASASGGEAETA
jgi:integrase